MLEVARAMRWSRGTEILTPLKRTSGAAQKGLHYRERVENIRGTIQLNRGSRCAAGLGRRVVLLDDIFTSGATADECARILRLAGVREVFALTLAMEL